jgi:chaperonin GroEL
MGSQQDDLHVRIDAGVRSARLALNDGVVPGGGTALLACIPALEAMAVHGDEAVGVQILAQALAEPMRAIVANAGLEAGPIVCEARRRLSQDLEDERRAVFDVVRREWVDAYRGGVIDALPVALTAVQASVSTAVTVLTADVLVHRRRPPLALRP